MGGKRVSDEEKVITFFQNAPSDAVSAVFRIVSGIVKNRIPKAPKKPSKKRVDSRQATIPATEA
jgi:hypothetical protein